MVLSGLGFSSWQAWLAGIYYIRKPWGLPSPTGYCFHPYVAYACTLNLISYAFWIDCHLKLLPISNKMSLSERIMSDAVALLAALFDIYFRFHFYRVNVEFADLLNALEQPKYKPLNGFFRKCWSRHKISLWVLGVPRYIVALFLVCAFASLTASYPDSSFLFPRFTYFFLYGIFTALPNASSIIFAYDIIVISTFHMLWTFEDYCVHLEDHIYKGYFLRKRFSVNPSPSIRSLITQSANDEQPPTRRMTNEFRNLKRLSDTEEGNGFEKMSFSAFVERFDWVQSLANKYDRCVGPVILGVVVRSVFCIVHSLNGILLQSESELGFKWWLYFIILWIEAGQLVILKLGSEIHDRLGYWKNKLYKAWLLTTACNEKPSNKWKGMDKRLNSTVESDDYVSCMDEVDYDNKLVQDLVHYVCSWNWKVSAAGIFDVNKALVGGIVSTTLTYVIILFQFNLAEPQSTCSKPTFFNKTNVDDINTNYSSYNDSVYL